MTDRDWQPIETAPKDGTRVITYSGGLVGTSRFIERFAAVYHEAPSPGWYSEQLDRRHKPTHWMPLPEPPAAQRIDHCALITELLTTVHRPQPDTKPNYWHVTNGRHVRFGELMSELAALNPQETTS